VCPEKDGNNSSFAIGTPIVSGNTFLAQKVFEVKQLKTGL